MILQSRYLFPHGLVDAPDPNWRQGFGVFEKTPLTNWFPNVSLSEPTDLIHWGLRFFIFAFIALLFVTYLVRKRRWPEGHCPPEPQGLTELPSDLPAPVVSVLGTREVVPLTYLSILIDMLQKGNLNHHRQKQERRHGPIHRQPVPPVRTRFALGKGRLRPSESSRDQVE